MASCARVRTRLRAYVDRELDPRTLQSVQVHLDECSGCRAAHGAMLSLLTVVQQTQQLEPPPHFSAGLQLRLEPLRARRRHPFGRLGDVLRRITQGSPRSWAGVTALATAAICLFAFTRPMSAEEIARRAQLAWTRVRNYGCRFVSEGYYQGQPRHFEQTQFYRRPAEFRLETSQDYRLTTFVSGDRVVHYLPGGEWAGQGPLVIVRPRHEASDVLPFPFGVTWNTGGNVSLDQLIRRLGENQAVKVVGTEAVAGRQCYHLWFQAATALPNRAPDTYDLWIDRDSFLPRRVLWYRDSQNRIDTTARDLQVNYDVLPVGTFEFTPPEGAVVVHGDIDPHVLALPIPSVSVTGDGRAVLAARAQGQDRSRRVPFQVYSPHWMPEGYEFVRVRARADHWVDMYWVRRASDGTLEALKLLQQSSSVGSPEPRSERTLALRRGMSASFRDSREPFANMVLSWVQGGTRLTLYAPGADRDMAARVAASMRRVFDPEPPLVAAAAPRVRLQRGTGEVSVIPELLAGPSTPSPLLHQSDVPAPPPMMPDVADEETARGSAGGS